MILRGRGTTLKAYLDPSDVRALEEAAGNLRDRLMIRLLFRLGCRVSEALALTPDDIDLDAGTVTILHLKQRIRLSCPDCGAQLGRRHEFCPHCGGRVSDVLRSQQEHRKQRRLPLDAGTIRLLKEYLERGGPVAHEGRMLIFGINRHRAWQVVKECAEKAGLPRLVNPETGRLRNVSPHRLRDSFAVHALKVDGSGDGLRLLQEHLGHASFNTTARYRKVAGEEHREWYRKLWPKQKGPDGTAT